MGVVAMVVTESARSVRKGVCRLCECLAQRCTTNARLGGAVLQVDVLAREDPRSLAVCLSPPSFPVLLHPPISGASDVKRSGSLHTVHACHSDTKQYRSSRRRKGVVGIGERSMTAGHE